MRKRSTFSIKNFHMHNYVSSPPESEVAACTSTSDTLMFLTEAVNFQIRCEDHRAARAISIRDNVTCSRSYQ